MKETTKEIIGAISFLLIGVVFMIGIMILVMQDANTKSKNYGYCNKTNFTMINEDINCSEYKGLERNKCRSTNKGEEYD